MVERTQPFSIPKTMMTPKKDAKATSCCASAEGLCCCFWLLAVLIHPYPYSTKLAFLLYFTPPAWNQAKYHQASQHNKTTTTVMDDDDGGVMTVMTANTNTVINNKNNNKNKQGRS
jgi:hypothetical protein